MRRDDVTKSAQQKVDITPVIRSTHGKRDQYLITRKAFLILVWYLNADSSVTVRSVFCSIFLLGATKGKRCRDNETVWTTTVQIDTYVIIFSSFRLWEIESSTDK